jgi:hypothetical protein
LEVDALKKQIAQQDLQSKQATEREEALRQQVAGLTVGAALIESTKKREKDPNKISLFVASKLIAKAERIKKERRSCYLMTVSLSLSLLLFHISHVLCLSLSLSFFLSFSLYVDCCIPALCLVSIDSMRHDVPQAISLRE